ncbi:MAG: hypothetical protein A2268_01015 [Candidatus Raymondbacteria bacterium RifOxyA12_full_50_37]|uniref:Uncharacterized protein n=1 Tax=Candidatus Raymondbacteria bacterium RIFOXYD12_FULL_49_13 TaxID=1817890 RepID=A0A1F7FFN9_UNCRA|nr:MAG: hypothetical protein A2268_01015 [Candidatus Raymondbacteria bacterium RifOxyA12_full_50_37]OGJ86383.1 MAG: hypothetical protein A2248_13980 [Candidatus Raymondbacteria bacterium RIFOXYA2_FULL_49_16]OGJ95553.1 MAG: hypothetical protein A2453_12755 [Candidatus Raymondbacteria bacterium RIFOXYC2_FULL_50_21]OGJ99450.1 MAG: hypothetical protein A2487_07510 [Candidatus Raymondbacteria bacterium RifOxyC12_full_50_8]OGJ99693.1 MAG: hypothetical protein A2350_07555 [Candidatus Raymondbacteria b
MGADAGTGSLAVGLSEAVWNLEKTRNSAVLHALSMFLDRESFKMTGKRRFQAFVAGKSHTSTHRRDAESATIAFQGALPDPKSGG